MLFGWDLPYQVWVIDRDVASSCTTLFSAGNIEQLGRGQEPGYEDMADLQTNVNYSMSLQTLR